MESAKGFKPNWTVHPGRHLATFLENNGVSKQALARRMGVAVKEVDDILEGGEINKDTASALEKGTSLSASFWRRAEAHYKRDLARLAPKAVGPMRITDKFLQLRGRAATSFKNDYVKRLAEIEDFENAQILNDAYDYVIFAEMYDEAIHVCVGVDMGKGTYVALGPNLVGFNMKQEISRRRRAAMPLWDLPLAPTEQLYATAS